MLLQNFGGTAKSIVGFFEKGPYKWVEPVHNSLQEA